MVMVLLVGVARVILHAHGPSEVLAGIALGWPWPPPGCWPRSRLRVLPVRRLNLERSRR